MKTKDLLPEKMAVGPFFWEETDMIENWNDVHIVPEFSDQGVDCYRLAGGSFINEYYIVSEAETRKLMSRCAHCSGGNGGDDSFAPSMPASSGGCAGCSGGNCATCGH